LQVYVADFASGARRRQISEDSGIAPQWSRDGKELYYLEQSTLSLVRTEVKFSSGVPRVHVLDKSNPNMLAELIYAVSPDNRRILIQRTPEPTVVLVANFLEAIEKK
jgi:Tol biopolymer transport system component